MALFNPTVNAYRRLNPEALVPTRVCWGHDNRFTFVRVPRERGSATRVEIRVGDGSANPYLAYTAALAAGLDGIRRGLEPPAPLSGFIYELPEEEIGPPLPSTLPDAIAALEADDLLVAAMGEELVSTFKKIKQYELNRYSQWVSDWELREYIHHL
jgi:glutamine synthetase